MKPGWRIDSLICTAGCTAERIGQNPQDESLFRSPTGGNAGSLPRTPDSMSSFVSDASFTQTESHFHLIGLHLHLNEHRFHLNGRHFHVKRSPTPSFVWVYS